MWYADHYTEVKFKKVQFMPLHNYHVPYYLPEISAYVRGVKVTPLFKP